MIGLFRRCPVTTAGRVQPHFFGKVPSRGDFVRSTGDGPLVQRLDDWMSRTLELLGEDARWQARYDAAAPVNFAILALHRREGLAGHLVASRDAAGRRFPFVTAASFTLPDPPAFLPCSPLALTPLWCRLEARARLARQALDFDQVRGRLSGSTVELDLRHELLQTSFGRFARQFTVGHVDAALAGPGEVFSFRRALLGLGLLLRPVRSQGHAGLSRGLLLPLPRAPMPRPHLLTMWVDLLACFFVDTRAELALFVTRLGEQPVLVVDFHGASPRALRSAMDPGAHGDHLVALARSEWIEFAIEGEHRLQLLSERLRDPSLTLADAGRLFRASFAGP